jgi:hypothetical protein
LLPNFEHVKYVHEEYERQINALRLERAVYKARAARANVMAQLANQCIDLISGLATATWRWGTRTWQQVRWTPPPLDKRDGATALRK